MARTKRSVQKKRRADRRRRERQTIFLVIAGAVLVLVAIIIGVNLIQANQPIGEIVSIDPIERPTPNGTAVGNPDAPVRIDVFEDFQCPACQVFTETVEPQIMDELVATGQVYYVFRQYPFLDDRSPTKESDQAANASLCAAEQDRFWDFHDILFANSGENVGAFTDRRLVAYAEDLNLNMKDFNACFNENRYKSQIDEDISEAIRLGISGTPSVYVNGISVRPGYIPTFEDVKAKVEAAFTGGGN